MATTSAEPARTNMANQQICRSNCSIRNTDRRVHVDPGTSWRARRGQQKSAQTSSRLKRRPPVRSREPTQVFAMHPLRCPVRLRTMSWTTGQAFALKRKCGPKLGPTSSCAITLRSHPAPVLESRLRSIRHNESADLGVKGSRVQISLARTKQSTPHPTAAARRHRWR
jgi:hypothetical protein